MARKLGRVLDKVKDAAILKKIKDAAKKGRIEFAPQKKLATLDVFVKRVMDAVLKVSGIPNCYFISDLSSFCDFQIDKKEALRLGRMLGVTVDRDDLIYDVAKRLKEISK